MCGEHLRRVSHAASNPAGRDSARLVALFFERYRHAVTGIVVRKLGSLATQDTVHSAVNDAFLLFLKRCADPRQRFEAERTDSDEECDRNVIAYLVRCAGWKSADVVRRERVRREESADPAVLEKRAGVLPPEETSAPRSREHVLVAQWIETLPAREEDILRAYYLDHHPDQKAERLPPAVVQALIARYGIGAPALRQIKAKLRRDLRAYLDTHLHASEES